MNKKITDKFKDSAEKLKEGAERLKESVPVEEIEKFTRKYTTEVFTAAALVVGAISCLSHFFSGPALTIFSTALGAILGVFFPEQIDSFLKALYNFTFKQRRAAQTVLGAFEVAIGFFLPFVLYGLVGLLAGTSYHYYTRHAQIRERHHDQ